MKLSEVSCGSLFAISEDNSTVRIYIKSESDKNHFICHRVRIQGEKLKISGAISVFDKSMAYDPVFLVEK